MSRGEEGREKEGEIRRSDFEYQQISNVLQHNDTIQNISVIFSILFGKKIPQSCTEVDLKAVQRMISINLWTARVLVEYNCCMILFIGIKF